MKNGVRLTIAVVAMTLAAGGVREARPAESRGSPAATKPNIVFILTDDLSWNLVQYMPNPRAMQKDGTTFSNYFVTNSLCCSLPAAAHERWHDILRANKECRGERGCWDAQRLTP